MARPSTAIQRRQDLLPTISQTFAKIGYRRTTTSELAAACDVPENTLYRLWGDKKQMYLAALEHLYERTVHVWQRRIDRSDQRSAAEQLLAYESTHYGEHGLYRIIFSGLSEIDDAEIKKALRDMYRRFHAFVAECIAAHRGGSSDTSAELTAWTVIGMATVAGIGRELRLVTRDQQQALFSEVGQGLID